MPIPLSHAIGRASVARRTLPPTSRAACASSLRLSLSLARHFRSTSPALFEDFDDVEQLSRKVHIETAEDKRMRRKREQDLARKRKQQWLRARKALEDEVLKKLPSLKENNNLIFQQAVEPAQERQRQAQLERRRQLQLEKERQLQLERERQLRLEEKRQQLERERRRLERERQLRIDKRSDTKVAPVRLECGHLVDAIVAVRSDVNAIRAARDARLQALIARRRALEEEVARLDGELSERYHDLQGIEKEIEEWEPVAKAAAHERAKQRETIEEFKVVTRRLKAGIRDAYYTIKHIEQCLSLDTTLPSTTRQRIISHDGTYGRLIPDADSLYYKSRQSFLVSWRKTMDAYRQSREGIELTIHQWEMWRQKEVYEGIDRKTQDFIYSFLKFAKDTTKMAKQIKSLQDLWKEASEEVFRNVHHRKPGDVLRQLREFRSSIAAMMLLNEYISMDMRGLRARHEIMNILKEGNLKTLWEFRILDLIRRTSIRFTNFNNDRFDAANWYKANRSGFIHLYGDEGWQSRQDMLEASSEYGLGWDNARDEEVIDVVKAVRQASKELEGTSKLEKCRERLVNYAQERLFDTYEEKSFLEEKNTLGRYPRLLWFYMRSWPESCLEAGMSLLDQNIKNASRREATTDTERRWSFERLKEGETVLVEARKLACERMQEQRSLLKLASVYQEPRYCLATRNATEERLEHVYFSHELYREDPGTDQAEQGFLRQPPKVLYHTSHATHSEVLRGLRGKFVGFDVRGKPGARSEDGPKANTSLLMIATDSTIHLLHLALQSDLQPLVLREVRMLLESEDVIKVTLAAKEKCARLQEFLGIEPRGFADLADLHHQVKTTKAGRDLPRLPSTLQNLTAGYLRYLLHPKAIDGAVDPTLRLRKADKEAMGSSVYACFALRHAMDKKYKTLLGSQEDGDELYKSTLRKTDVPGNEQQVPYPHMGANATESEKPLHGNSASEGFKVSVRTSVLKNESDAVMTVSGGQAVESNREARKWAGSQSILTGGDTRSRLFRTFFYHRLWHHHGISVYDIHDEHGWESQPKEVALNIANAIKYFDQPPGDHERMAELREMLGDEYLPYTIDFFPSSVNAIEPSSPEYTDGDVRKHWAAADEWATKHVVREEVMGASLPDVFYEQNGRGHTMLTYYRLWHSHGCSVAALQEWSFPGAFLMMNRKRTIAIAKDILEVLESTRSPYDDQKLRDLLEILPKEEQQGYQGSDAQEYRAWKRARSVGERLDVRRDRARKWARTVSEKPAYQWVGSKAKDGGRAGAPTMSEEPLFKSVMSRFTEMKAPESTSKDGGQMGMPAIRRVQAPESTLKDDGHVGVRVNRRVGFEASDGVPVKRPRTEAGSRVKVGDGRVRRSGFNDGEQADFKINGGGQTSGRGAKAKTVRRRHERKKGGSTEDAATVMMTSFAGKSENGGGK